MLDDYIQVIIIINWFQFYETIKNTNKYLKLIIIKCCFQGFLLIIKLWFSPSTKMAFHSILSLFFLILGYAILIEIENF